MLGIWRGDVCAGGTDVGVCATDADGRARRRLLVAQHQRNRRVMAERTFPVVRENRACVDVGQTDAGVEVVRIEPKCTLAHGDSAAQRAERSLGLRRNRSHRNRGVHDGERARPRLEQTGAAQRITPRELLNRVEHERVALAHIHAHLLAVAVEVVAVCQRAPITGAHDDSRESRPLRIHVDIRRCVCGNVETDGRRGVRRRPQDTAHSGRNVPQLKRSVHHVGASDV